jgi:hypothetical protein
VHVIAGLSNGAFPPAWALRRFYPLDLEYNSSNVIAAVNPLDSAVGHCCRCGGADKFPI